MSVQKEHDMKRRLAIIIYMAALISAISCCKEPINIDTATVDKVCLLYSAGYNDISTYLENNIEQLKKGKLPGKSSDDNVLLVLSHQSIGSNGFTVGTSPALFRLYRDKKGNTIADTLKTYAPGTVSASAETVRDVLTFVKNKYTAKSYGMIFSSHGTGFLPTGYYSDSESYENPTPSTFSEAGKAPKGAVRYVAPDFDPSLPKVKSIGNMIVKVDGVKYTYEINIDDFADAIPMYLDYLIIDACLMGGIEVAYELKDKCHIIGFSQTEILAEGFVYDTITSHLLKSGSPDIESVCDDYFNQYKNHPEPIYRSATISTVDCTKLEGLTSLCKNLFEKYRTEIAKITPANVQHYYRGRYHWFYDLESILINAGIDESEKALLEDELAKCITYKAATETFLSSITIKTHSGLSMYLPCNGGKYLDNYYKGLAWNKATGLVQ